MIKIYYFPECPFCQRVLQKIEELNLKSGKDIQLILAYPGTKERKELVELGGKSQVPFLVDGEVKMYESLDINEYLQKKFKNAGQE